MTHGVSRLDPGKTADLAPLGDAPEREPSSAQVTPHEQGFTVGRDRHRVRRAVKPGDHVQLATRVAVPVPDASVRSGCEDRRIRWRDDQVADPRTMTGLREYLTASGHIPETDHRLGTGRGQRPPVRGEAHRTDPSLVRREMTQLLAPG